MNEFVRLLEASIRSFGSVAKFRKTKTRQPSFESYPELLMI